MIRLARSIDRNIHEAKLPLATADIVIVWVTILWCLIAVWLVYQWVAVAQVPYFVWVSIATVLQLSITAMNW